MTVVEVAGGSGDGDNGGVDGMVVVVVEGVIDSLLESKETSCLCCVYWLKTCNCTAYLPQSSKSFASLIIL